MNAFEALARLKKVGALLSYVPTGVDRAANERVAAVLESWSKAARNTLAATAGVHPPSDETWRIVVSGVRARIPQAELVARES